MRPFLTSSREAALWAAVLDADSGAVLSHYAASELDGLMDGQRDAIHVTIPRDRTIRQRQGVVLHRSNRAAEARHHYAAASARLVGQARRQYNCRIVTNLRRDNSAVAEHGMTTLRYSWLDITTRPCRTAAQIAPVLASSGHTGALLLRAGYLVGRPGSECAESAGSAALRKRRAG